MKRWIFALLLVTGPGFARAQTVGDSPARFMMIWQGGLMTPLKKDLLGDVGLSRILPAFSGGLHYYFNENWGAGIDVQIASLPYIHNKKKSFYRKEYIPERYTEINFNDGRYSMESNFVAGGAFFRKRIGALWLETGLLAGVIKFETLTASNYERPVYYKEEGSNFIYQHKISDLDDVTSFVVSPQVSIQYKLSSRLGLALNLGVMQPYRKVNYTMTLTDVFSQEDRVVESYEGKVNAPLFFSRLSLILNFKAIKGKG